MIRGIIIEVIEGAIKRFSASGRADEEIDDRELFQHYGFTSRALAGAETIIIQEGAVYLSIAEDDRRYRISIESGEVAIYDDLGQKVHLTRSGIEIYSATKITVEAPSISLIAASDIKLDAPETHASGNFHADTGATGNFRSFDGKNVVVQDGIVTDIE